MHNMTFERRIERLKMAVDEMITLRAKGLIKSLFQQMKWSLWIDGLPSWCSAPH